MYTFFYDDMGQEASVELPVDDGENPIDAWNAFCEEEYVHPSRLILAEPA